MPLLSPLGDRCNKRLLIRLGKLGLVLDALVLALLAGGGVYNLLMCACGSLALLLPGQASILTELVATAQLPEAIRLRRGAQAIGGLIGPGIGGAALALGGTPAATLLNLLMFGIAAVAAWRIAAPPFPAARAACSRWFAEMTAELRAKWGVPVDRW